MYVTVFSSQSSATTVTRRREIGSQNVETVREVIPAVSEINPATSFDEGFYLRTNPDVAAAVERGDWSSGRAHWEEFGQAEGRAGAPPEVPAAEELIRSKTTEMVFIELTSRCNLRCVYCAVSQPTYRGIDLALDGFENFVEQMKERSVKLVNLNGHGESTIIKHWEAYADRLADAGFRLHITTNLAKRLKPEEVAAFSRFERILVSIDTVDPELLANLRRGANLETILENIRSILEFAGRRGRNPEIAVSFTVGDLSAPGVEELVDVLLPIGVRTFRFGDLIEYAPIESTLRMRHISALPGQDHRPVRQAFERALEKIEQSGGRAVVDASLRAWLNDETESTVHAESRHSGIGDKSVWADEVGEGLTRDCLDPWNLAFVQADATVRPCCFFEEKLGSLAEGTLEEIVEGEAFHELRRELLTGRLRPNCRSCQSRALIDVRSFAEKLASTER